MGVSNSRDGNENEQPEASSQRGSCLIIETNDQNNNIQSGLQANNKNQNFNSNDLQLNTLKFHEVCGKNILLSNSKHIAQRLETSFCDAIAFSSRPIGVYERVYIRILKLNTLWNGMIRFGFTSVNPDILRKKSSTTSSLPNENKNNNPRTIPTTEIQANISLEANSFSSEHFSYENDDESFPFNLPKYVYPDLTNKKGYWAAAMTTEEQLKENDVIYFYVNSNGEIHFGINNKYKGKFLEGVNVYNNRPQQAQPLWAIFDIYGNTLAVELINNPIECPSENQNTFRQNNHVQSHYESPATSSSQTIDEIISPLSDMRIHSRNILSSAQRGSLDSSSQSIVSSLNSSNNSSMYNNITVIPNTRNLNSSNNNNNEEQLNRLFISCRRLCVDNHLNETLHSSILDANGTSSQQNNNFNDLNEKIRSFYQTIPVLIHDGSSNGSSSNRFLTNIHGKNVKISEPDGLIAYRESSIIALKDRYFTKSTVNSKEPTRNTYSFIENPIKPGKSFCIQIVGLDQSLNESKMSLGIGCTTCKPNHLNPIRDLPDDADELLDRPEYWIVHKNLFNMPTIHNYQASVADELCFFVDEANGNLNFYINNQLVTNCLFSVDLTQELYFFFDLCGKTNAIRVIPSCHIHNSSSNRLRSCGGSRRQRPNSALIDYYKNQFLTQGNMNELLSTSSDCHETSMKSKSDDLEECRICLDAPIECVFYTCGHMCVCWKCALQLKKEASKPAPLIATTAVTGSIYTSSSTLQGSPSVTTSTSRSYLINNEPEKKSRHPLCPICRNEIIDIIRFFKS